MQEADRDRANSVGRERAHRVRHLLGVERSEDLAIGERALLHSDPMPAWDQRLIWRYEQIVERDLDRLDPAANLDAVAETLGRNHAGAGAAAGQQDVGRERGAMHKHIDLPEKLPDIQLVMAGGFFHRIHEADRWIAWRRRSLELLQQPRFIHDQAIGEGAADVDTDALLFHFLPFSVIN